MSQWHRDNPELMGTEADPWMRHESYRNALGSLAELKREMLAEQRDLEEITEDLELLSKALFTPADDRCHACGGAGAVPANLTTAREAAVVPCAACKGTGRRNG